MPGSESTISPSRGDGFLSVEPISLAEPDLGNLERSYVNQALDSTWISSTGEFIDRFEREFAKMCGTSTSLAVANGTVALHLALLCLDVGPGDEVIIPSLTYVATANAVRYVGATPVFVDIDPHTWCIDPEAVEAAVTPRTKAVIAVHLYGHPADMDAINAVAQRNGLRVVEDAAEAHFARCRKQVVGGLSDIATFSFYGNKILTCGEGGAITLNSDELAEKARLLRGQGMDPQRRYFFPVVGFNFRLTNLACAILCAQLERSDEIIARRQQVVDWYNENLDLGNPIGMQPVQDWADPAPWLYSMTVGDEDAQLRDSLASFLHQNGVDSRPFFIPVHSLPPYQSAFQAVELPHTMRTAATGINLPTHSRVSEENVVRICTLIKSFLA